MVCVTLFQERKQAERQERQEMTEQYNMTEIITYFVGAAPNEEAAVVLFICGCVLGMYLIIYMFQLLGFFIDILKYRMI